MKKVTPKSKKCDNSTLYPNDSLAKQSKDDFFEAVLDCDLATFLSLNQDDMLSKFKSAFSKLDDVDQLRLDNSALTSQVSALKKELTIAKLVIADQEIKFRAERSSAAVAAKVPV